MANPRMAMFIQATEQRSLRQAATKAIGWEGVSFVVLLGVALTLLQMKKLRAARVTFALAAAALAVKLMFSSETYLPDEWIIHGKWMSVIISAIFLVGMLCWVSWEAKKERLSDKKDETARSEASGTSAAPNIICLGEDRLDCLELDRHQVFRESDDYGAGALRPVAAKFTNAPRPPERVGRAENVVAQVLFYEPDWPDREEYRVDHACWLNEESPYVSFGLDTVHHVVIGVFQHKIDGTSGFEPDFTIYGNSPDRNAPLSKYRDRFTTHFNIKIRLIVGEHGEFTSEYDFDLQHTPGQGFSFGYISEKEKQLRNESNKTELKRFIVEGDKLFNTPLISVDWDKLYSDIHGWSAKVYGLVRRNYGLVVSSRVDSSVATHSYPHKIAGGRKRFFDEYYSRFAALQEFAKEQGVLFTTKSAEEVSRERSERITADLSAFCDEGSELLHNTLHGPDSGIRMRMMKWEDRIYAYLENHVDKDAAISFIRDTELEAFVLPEDMRTFSKDLLDRIYTRITRLKTLIEQGC